MKNRIQYVQKSIGNNAEFFKQLIGNVNFSIFKYYFSSHYRRHFPFSSHSIHELLWLWRRINKKTHTTNCQLNRAMKLGTCFSLVRKESHTKTLIPNCRFLTVEVLPSTSFSGSRVRVCVFVCAHCVFIGVCGSHSLLALQANFNMSYEIIKNEPTMPCSSFSD